MKRLVVIDFRENGISKHKCVEFRHPYGMSDAELVTACVAYIGNGCELDSVVEVLEDMSAGELNAISLCPESLFLARKPLYINMSEAIRTARLIMNIGG